jgi:hypothetical protein
MTTTDAYVITGLILVLLASVAVFVAVWADHVYDQIPSRSEVRRRWESGEVEQMMRDAEPYSRRDAS